MRGHLNDISLSLSLSLSRSLSIYIYTQIYVRVFIYIYTLSQVQLADGSKKPKHVAKICKFIRYLLTKICVRLYFII